MPYKAKAEAAAQVGNATVTRPAGTVEGDVMFAAIVVQAGGIAAVPADWTLIRAQGQLFTYRKVATGAEPANYTWTPDTGGADWCALIMTFDGVDSSAPVDVSGGSSNPIAGNSVTATGIVTTRAPASLLVFVASMVTNNLVPPGQLVERADFISGGFASLGAYEGLRDPAGATGNGVFASGVDAAQSHQQVMSVPIVGTGKDGWGIPL